MLGHSLADDDGTILAIDAAMADFLHRERRDIVGRSYLDITYAGDRTRNEMVVSTLESDAGAKAFRKRYLRADGEVKFLNVSVSRLRHGLDAGRLLGTFQIPDARLDRAPLNLWAAAIDALTAERRRRARIAPDIMGDVPWIVLLHAYLAEAEGRALDVAEIQRFDGIAAAQTARWLRVFADKGLVEGLGVSSAGCQLTKRGYARIEAVLRER